MDFGCLCVNAGSCLVTKAPFRWVMLIMGEPMSVWGQEIYGKSLPPSEFCCKPETALRKRSLKKKKDWSKKALVPSGMLLRWEGLANKTETEAITTDWTFNFPRVASPSADWILSPLGLRLENLIGPVILVLCWSQSSSPAYLHSFIQHIDWAPTSARGESSEGSQGLGMYVCRGVSCNF